MSSGLGSLIWGCQLSNYWFLGTWLPFFAVPSFTFKLTLQAVLLQSFGQSFMRWSGLLHPKQFWFFFWYSAIALAKLMIEQTCLSAPPIPFEVSGSSSEDSASSSPSGFTLKSSSAPMLSTMADQAVKVWVPFSFLEGKNPPMSVWLGNIWSSSLLEWWEKVDFGGGPMSIQSAGSSRGRKGCLPQLGIPFCMVPPPTDPSLSSSPCRHWL